ncbi:MAG TPA: gliding motility-associated C-terminal domain-containing protein, partial [Prolixibacteraceae bacterium]|nr:gliding motility-associated C-terminal domain-containing protein [Prolixibacteraceae bacterium]
YHMTLAECVDDDTVRVTVWDPPLADAGPDVIICSGNEYKVRFAKASSYASLSWTHNGTGTMTGKNTMTPVYKAGENEVGQVTLTLTAKPNGSEGCSDAVDAMVITVLPKPEIICPQPASFTFQATPGYCGYLVTSNLLDASGDKACCADLLMNHDFYQAANLHTLRGTVLPIGTTTIKWWASAFSETCTSDTCYITVKVIDPVVPEFISCPEGKEFTVGLVGNNCSGGASWNIPVARDNCPGVQVKQIKGPELGSTLQIGRYNIVYVAYDLSGNTDTCSFFLNVVTSQMPILICPPSLTVDSDPGLCAWTSTTNSLSPLLAQSACPYTLTWEVINPDGSKNSGVNNVSGYVFRLGRSAVKYILKENASGQTVECAFTVTVQDKEPPIVFCPGSTMVETANGKCDAEVDLRLPGFADACNSPVQITYTVINPDNSMRGPYQSNALKYLFLSGTSRVIWTLSDGAGNKVECIQEVRVSVSNKDIIPFAGNDTTICEGSALLLSKTKVSPFARVLWSTSGTGTFKDPDTANPTYIPGVMDIMNGKVMLTLKAFTDCASASDYMMVSISAKPKLSAGADFAVCSGEEITIDQATAENVAGIKWTTTGKGTLTTTAFLATRYKPAAGETGVVSFILSANGKDGCSAAKLTDTLKVTIYEPLQVLASGDISILKNYTTILSAVASNGSGFYYFSWQPPDQVQAGNSNVTETKALTASTSFVVTVTDDKRGCVARDTVNVTVKDNIDDLLVIYNAISPNGDKLNDIWWIDGIELFPDNAVMIFNRWGDKISEFAGYDNNRVYWDGTNTHGKRVPDGTYYYVLKIRNIKTYTGWIQVKSSL